MRQLTGWIVAAVLAVVAIVLYLRPGEKVAPAAKYPKQERFGMAVVIKQGNQCKVAGGPKNHIAQPDEKVTWNVIHACDAATAPVVVELKVDSFTPSTCPSPPFTQNPPYATVAMNLGDMKKLELRVKDQGFTANTECRYQYSIGIQGQPNSGIDPEMDIWP